MSDNQMPFKLTRLWQLHSSLTHFMYADYK